MEPDKRITITRELGGTSHAINLTYRQLLVLAFIAQGKSPETALDHAAHVVRFYHESAPNAE